MGKPFPVFPPSPRRRRVRTVDLLSLRGGTSSLSVPSHTLRSTVRRLQQALLRAATTGAPEPAPSTSTWENEEDTNEEPNDSSLEDGDSPSDVLAARDLPVPDNAATATGDGLASDFSQFLERLERRANSERIFGRIHPGDSLRQVERLVGVSAAEHAEAIHDASYGEVKQMLETLSQTFRDTSTSLLDTATALHTGTSSRNDAPSQQIRPLLRALNRAVNRCSTICNMLTSLADPINGDRSEEAQGENR